MATVTSSPEFGRATPIPPLRAGDRLSAEEFERRYSAMPELKKAELIEGVVYMPSPVRADDHGEQHADLMSWLGAYRAYTPGIQCCDNSTVRLDSEGEPQPDGLMRIRPEYGGRSRTVDGYVVGGPELTAEVSASTVSYDLHDKLETFRLSGVQEYVVWRVEDRAVDWFRLINDRYEPLALSTAGRYESLVLPGLWLDALALTSGNMARVLEVAQLGVASAEHAAFVARLNANHSA